MPYKSKNARGQESPFWSISYIDPKTGVQVRETTTMMSKLEAYHLEQSKRLSSKTARRVGDLSVFEKLFLPLPKENHTGTESIGVGLKKFARLALDIKGGSRKGGWTAKEMDAVWDKDKAAIRLLAEEHKALKAKGVKPRFNLRTLVTFVQKFQEPLLFFGDCDPASLNADDISRYIRKRKEDDVAAATINRELDSLSNVYRYALTHEDYRNRPIKNPVTRLLHYQTEAPPKQRYWFQNEREIFVKTAFLMLEELYFPAELLVDIARCAWTMGPRITELLTLRVHQVQLDAETLVLGAFQTKNKKKRYVRMISAEVVEVFRRNIAGRRPDDFVFHWAGCHKRKNGGDNIEYETLHRAFELVCKRAELRGVKIHDWRKTAAIDWRVGGMDIDDIQDELQHSDITTTQRYVDKALVRQLKEIRQKAA